MPCLLCFGSVCCVHGGVLTASAVILCWLSGCDVGDCLHWLCIAAPGVGVFGLNAFIGVCLAFHYSAVHQPSVRSSAMAVANCGQALMLLLAVARFGLSLFYLLSIRVACTIQSDQLA